MMRLIGTTILVAIVAVACGGGDDEHGAAALEAQDGATAAESAGEPGPTGVGATKIAFARGLDLWLMNPDGMELERLTGRVEAGSWCATLSWSPDGGKLAFTREGDIHTKNVDGTGFVRNLTKAGRGVLARKLEDEVDERVSRFDIACRVHADERREARHDVAVVGGLAFGTAAMSLRLRPSRPREGAAVR